MFYFIGIKGSGMSALACVLHDLGYEVMGSDIEKECFTEEGLRQRNIRILPFNKNNIKKGMYIVKGNSFKDDHEEIKAALALELPIYTYQEMIKKITKMFKLVTVAGCHGKTTTSSMLAHVLNDLVGANYLIGDGSGFALKENKWFVLEACEYQRHFLEYKPEYAIITNIDYDHPDYFKDITDVVSAYEEYANTALKMVIACGDDSYTHSLEVEESIFYYGLDEDNDIQAKNVFYNEDGTIFDVFIEGNYYGHFDLPFYGKHQLLNALAVISFCYYERFEAKEVAKSLKTFNGAKRRFSEKVVGSNILIDDYAHHPAEMKATLKALKQKYPHKDIVIVFQPHTFSRTQAFKDEYIDFLKDYKTYIMEIHPAREKQEDYNIRAEDLLKELPNAEKININEASKLLKYENSVLVFMSPNDISKLENDYITLKEKS